MLEELYTTQPNHDNVAFYNLNSLYRTLTEEDFYHGLCYQHSVVEDSKSALIFEQMGLWQKAHEVKKQKSPPHQCRSLQLYKETFQRDFSLMLQSKSKKCGEPTGKTVVEGSTTGSSYASSLKPTRGWMYSFRLAGR
jgi:hypothetical protein